MDQVDLAYDSAEHLLILVITPSGALEETAETRAFDPDLGTWSRRADVPNTLSSSAIPPPGRGVDRSGSAHAGRSLNTAMLAYDARADEWTLAERGPGWPAPTMVGDEQVDPVARLVDTMVVDPINERLVVIGGLVRRMGDPAVGSSSRTRR